MWFLAERPKKVPYFKKAKKAGHGELFLKKSPFQMQEM